MNFVGEKNISLFQWKIKRSKISALRQKMFCANVRVFLQSSKHSLREIRLPIERQHNLHISMHTQSSTNRFSSILEKSTLLQQFPCLLSEKIWLLKIQTNDQPLLSWPLKAISQALPFPEIIDVSTFYYKTYNKTGLPCFMLI